MLFLFGFDDDKATDLSVCLLAILHHANASRARGRSRPCVLDVEHGEDLYDSARIKSANVSVSPCQSGRTHLCRSPVDNLVHMRFSVLFPAPDTYLDPSTLRRLVYLLFCLKLKRLLLSSLKGRRLPRHSRSAVVDNPAAACLHHGQSGEHQHQGKPPTRLIIGVAGIWETERAGLWGLQLRILVRQRSLVRRSRRYGSLPGGTNEA